MFYGPPGTGKSLAVRALVTECNALLIDLSPSNLTRPEVDKTDAKGILQLFNCAIKVAVENQPAIIYLEDFEMIFQGKAGGKKKKDQDPNLPLYGKMK